MPSDYALLPNLSQYSYIGSHECTSGCSAIVEEETVTQALLEAQATPGPFEDANQAEQAAMRDTQADWQRFLDRVRRVDDASSLQRVKELYEEYPGILFAAHLGSEALTRSVSVFARDDDALRAVILYGNELGKV